MHERAMPREGDSSSKELEVAGVGVSAHKKKASWKQPLAEAVTRCEPLVNVVARFSQ